LTFPKGITPLISPPSVFFKNFAIGIFYGSFDKIISSIQQGKYQAGEYMYGMRDGGVIFKIHQPSKVPAAVMDQINEIQRRIMAGELKIEANTAQPETAWKL